MSRGHKWHPWVVPIPEQSHSIERICTGVAQNFERFGVDAAAYDNVDLVISCSVNRAPVTTADRLVPMTDQVVAVPGRIIFEAYPPDLDLSEIKDYGMRVLELDQFVGFLQRDITKKETEIALLKAALNEKFLGTERRVKINR